MEGITFFYFTFFVFFIKFKASMDNKHTLNTIFIFGLFALLFVLLGCMLYPFSTVILWTILIYILTNPLHKKCLNKIDKQKKFYEAKRHALAGGFSIGVFLLIILPLIGACFLIVQQFLSFLKSVEDFFIQNPDFFTTSELGKWIVNIAEKLDFNFIDLNEASIKAKIMELVSQYSSKLISFGTNIVSKAGNFVISLLFIVFALYFCFLDGGYLTALIKKAIPIEKQKMTVLTTKFADITRNLFSGYILVALYQGLASLIIMLIFRVDGALLLSVLLMFASFIPIVGAAIVWLPVGIVLCVSKSMFIGILFIIICGFCVSFLDNFLRPFFLKDRIKVHPLVIFFAILGGISVFGLNGLLLGPIIVILFFSVLDMIVGEKN